MKLIWFVNKYSMPPELEPRPRSIKFAHYLNLMGYKTKVFGSSVLHNMNTNLITDGASYVEKQYGDISFVHVKTPSYKKTSGLARVFSDFYFHWKLRFIAHKFEKPDVIIATTSPVLTNPLLDYAHKHGIKYITDIEDMWPDDFVDFGFISESNPLMKLAYKQARYNYTMSDASVFTLSGCYDYLKQKKWDDESGGPVDISKVFYINNGVDLDFFNDCFSKYTIADEDLTQSTKKNIIYLGSIRLVNNLIQAIKAAEILKNRNDIQFLIYGDGDDRESLIEYCKEHDLVNVKFKAKWTDPKYVPFILKHGYLNLLNYVSSDFAKRGISSGKMFQYMASGRPIVCNINILNCPITEHNIGIAHELKTPQEYASAIEEILSLSKEEYEAMCIRSYKTAEEFDFKYLAKRMAGVIEQL